MNDNQDLLDKFKQHARLNADIKKKILIAYRELPYAGKLKLSAKLISLSSLLMMEGANEFDPDTGAQVIRTIDEMDEIQERITQMKAREEIEND